METVKSPEIPDKPPVDPGCLPAWKLGEMPVPAPFNVRNLLAILGPSLVMIGGTIGTGEWVIGSGVAALYRGAFLWVAPLAILCQVILNSEAMRYTLVTGEPAFTGFLRSKPGPRFWLLFYLLLDGLSWLPSLAGLAAQILLFTVTGKDPDPTQVRITGVAILLLCAVLLCFGGKIYNTLEVVLGGKVIFVLGFLLFACLFYVPGRVWGEVVGGMVNPLKMPADGPPDWTLVASVAGLAGIGGLSNILASNYVREKGWGMGALVGSIPSAVGGSDIKLSNLGTMALPTPEGVERFKQWWGYIRRDQYYLWGWGSVVGMLLPCLLGAAYITSDYRRAGSDVKAAIGMAQDFGAVHGHLFMVLTLICGFIIMFPGQFSSMDGIARRWTDALWSGSRRARASQPHTVKYVYYSFVALYVTIGIIINGIGISPKNMMVFNSNLANLAIMCSILHVLYVNTRFLPKEFRPPIGPRVGLCLAAVFYFTLFAFSVTQTVMKFQAGKLFS